jgi:class 3 adenylate cyclase/tetratricopeptide (TPR) repeat protein
VANEGIVVCAACGTESPVGRKFCSECGSPLARSCPTCGAQTQPGQKFCSECGTQLAEGSAAPAAAAGQSLTAAAGAAGSSTPVVPIAAVPVAERRLVTVLFADLVGFTAFSEGRDAEETRELLSRYFEGARDAVTRYGGTVEKFIGDAVMAVWGTPTAHEDDAERAVRTALDLIDAVRQLGPGIEARVGVMTGEAAVTLGAAGQGMVAGDLVNTASRLQGVAPPGTVLTGERTRRAANAAIAFEPAGEQLLKGKEAPVQAFRALRVIAQRGGRGRTDRLEAPFVGREVELRLLKDFFHATGRERRPRLVSIIGQAGVGKSRLAWELHKYIDGIVESVLANAGRSPAYGEGVTFWALGEIVRERTGLKEGDDEETTRRKIAETLDERVPDPVERRQIEPALLTLLGIEPAPAGGREELFTAWRTFLERGAAGRTTILTFEDLQWADAGLLDFIDYMLEWSRGQPLMVLVLARPELLDRRPDWGAGRRNAVTLSLEPLPEEAMRALLAGLAPGLPEATVRRIVQRADGIPLYAVETVRMLVNDGRLVETEDGYRPTGDLDDVAIPETLQALISARLDALDPIDRSLLQNAAVLGQSFPYAALAAVTELPTEELTSRLSGLVQRELLTILANPSSPETGQYEFVQALIREVAYSTLAKRDRRSKHLAAARYFESLGDDELAGVLAAHYLSAYRESPPGPEADALAIQARLALRGAADRATALGSNEQATTFLEQAIDVTTDPEEVELLLEQAGVAADAAGRLERAESLLSRAVEAARTTGTGEALQRSLAHLASFYNSSGRAEQAVRLLEPLVDGDDRPVSGGSALLVRSQLARAYFFAGDAERAVRVSDQVLAAAERSGDMVVLTDTLITKGTALGMMARTREGLALIAGGRELAQRYGLGASTVRAYANETSIMTGVDPRRTLELARRGLEECRRLGRRSTAVVLLINGAQVAERTGDWTWATEAVAAEISELEGIDRATLLTELARLKALRGEPTEDIVAEIELLLRGYDDIQSRAETGSMRALRALLAGRPTEAADGWLEAGSLKIGEPELFLHGAWAAVWAHDVARAHEALRQFDEMGARGEAYDTRRGALGAGVAALQGRPAEALPVYREALRTWHDMGLVVDEALTAIDMVELLPPGTPEVDAAAAAAREILAGLGAGPYLARLDAAMAARAGGSASTGAPGRAGAAEPASAEADRSIGTSPS